MIAGSKGMSGAAYLSAKAAYAVGAGLVQIYTHEENRVILQQLLPEVIITTYDTFDSEQLEKLIQWADLIGIGCGLGKSDTAERVMQYTLKRALVPCVVDADGINILSKHMEWIEETNALIVLTPHMKEMSRMLQCSVKELIEQRMEKLHAFVERYKVVCVLKRCENACCERASKYIFEFVRECGDGKGRLRRCACGSYCGDFGTTV